MGKTVLTTDREIFVLHQSTAEIPLEVDGNVARFPRRLVMVLVEADKAVRGNPQIRRAGVNQHRDLLLADSHVGYVRLPSQLDRRHRFPVLASSDVILIESQYAPQRVVLGQGIATPPYGDMIDFVGDSQDGSMDSGGRSQLERRGRIVA